VMMWTLMSNLKLMSVVTISMLCELTSELC